MIKLSLHTILGFLPRDAMQARPMLPVCLSVTFLDSVEMNKHFFKIISLSGSHTIIVFRDQTLRQYYQSMVY